jgi:hypothetical protein
VIVIVIIVDNNNNNNNSYCYKSYSVNKKYCSKQGEKIMVILIVIIIISKFGFKDNVLDSWDCKACYIPPLMSLDWLTIKAAIDFLRQQLRRGSQ